MIRALLFILFSAILLDPTIPASAQAFDIKFINQKSIGGFASIGFPLYDVEEGIRYNPFVLGGSLHLPFYQTKSKFGVGIGILPQVGFVPYNSSMEYEFGFNITFTFGFQLSPRGIFSINIGTGPHYYTADIGRQAPGFIFADHFNLAYRHKFTKLEASITLGIRHISNAGLEAPNRGIENIGLGVSLAKLY